MLTIKKFHQIISKLTENDNKFSIKINNIYFKNNAQQFCDAYLAKLGNEWSIMLNGNGNKICLYKPQLDFLITKMENLDAIVALKDKLDYKFGLTSFEGLKVDNKYYKLLFQYQTHYNNQKMKIPFQFMIKDFNNRYRVDFDTMLLHLYKYRNILNNLLLNSGSIKIEFIYNINEEKYIYKKKAYNNSNNNSSTEQKNNDKCYKCQKCKAKINRKVFDYSIKNYGQELCLDCQKASGNKGKCKDCKCEIDQTVANYSKRVYGQELCLDCQKKTKNNTNKNKCSSCEANIDQKVANYSKRVYDQKLCLNCQKKVKSDKKGG